MTTLCRVILFIYHCAGLHHHIPLCAVQDFLTQISGLSPEERARVLEADDDIVPCHFVPIPLCRTSSYRYHCAVQDFLTQSSGLSPEERARVLEADDDICRVILFIYHCAGLHHAGTIVLRRIF